MEQISKEAKRSRAEYMREYRRLHPEKTREINARYWEKKAAAEREVKLDAETTAAED